MTAREVLLVGRVARPHGLRGHVYVNPETDFPADRFRVGQVLLVGGEGQALPRGIREVRFHQGRPIVAFDGVDTMDGAEALAGLDVWVPRDAVDPLPDGTFYRHDLIGCEVLGADNAVIGRVTAVEGTLDRSYLVVDGDVMLPLVEGICVNVDTAARRIVVQPPAGLLELYRS